MTLKDLIQIFKLRIVFLLVFIAVLSYLIASKDDFRIDILILLILSGFLSASGSSALNNYFDRDLDAVMDRTKNRPIPSGRIQPELVLFLSFFLISSGISIAIFISIPTAVSILSGVLIYNVVYTLYLKRKSTLNIVIGGFAGSFSVLAGFSAANQMVSLDALLFSLLVFLWTPSHFWSFAMLHVNDYKKAGIPMLPAVFDEDKSRRYICVSTLLLLAFSLLLSLSDFGYIYLLTSLLSGSFLGYLSIGILRARNYYSLIYRFSGIYLSIIFFGAVLDSLLY